MPGFRSRAFFRDHDLVILFTVVGAGCRFKAKPACKGKGQSGPAQIQSADLKDEAAGAEPGESAKPLIPRGMRSQLRRRII